MPIAGSFINDSRRAERTSLYLAAALSFDGSSTPVMIRNISAAGALIEGATLPKAGAVLHLVRGALAVRGIAMWATGGRCGVSFSDNIDVQQWRAARKNTEQQRVDEVVRLVKAGAVPLPVRSFGHSSKGGENAPGSAELSRDLRLVSDLVGRLGEELARDSELVKRHGAALQLVDIAMQIIGAVETTLAGREDAGNSAAKLEGLRRSADEALRPGS